MPSSGKPKFTLAIWFVFFFLHSCDAVNIELDVLTC